MTAKMWWCTKIDTYNFEGIWIRETMADLKYNWKILRQIGPYQKVMSAFVTGNDTYNQDSKQYQ